MVERRVCTFCGSEIEPGTGRMYIKKDGVVYNFCTSKCFKNMVILGRVPRRTTWTRYYEREKEVRMKGEPIAEEAPRAKKIPKTPAQPEEKKPVAEKPAEKKEEPKAAPPEEKPKPKLEEKKPAAKTPGKAPAKRTVKKPAGSSKEPSKEKKEEKPRVEPKEEAKK